MKELDEAIKKLKINKAPGPDETPAELFKWLDGESRKVILETLNECWRDAKLMRYERCKTGSNTQKRRNRPTAKLQTYTAKPRTKILRFWSLGQEDLIHCAWTFGKSTRVK